MSGNQRDLRQQPRSTGRGRQVFDPKDGRLRMSVVRVSYATLAAIAAHLQPLPQRLAEARQEVLRVKASSYHVGDPAAAADTDELMRQLAWLVDANAQLATTMVKGLAAGSNDYATAEGIAMRFGG